jgi:hypothetical protein
MIFYILFRRTQSPPSPSCTGVADASCSTVSEEKAIKVRNNQKKKVKHDRYVKCNPHHPNVWGDDFADKMSKGIG